MRFTASSLVLLGLAGSTVAIGQVQNPDPVRPLCVMWQQAPVGTAPNPKVVPMQIVNVHEAAEHPDPEDAAQALAQLVLTNFTAGHVTASNCTVMLRGFAHDWYNSLPGWPTDPFDPAVSFWDHVADPLPGLTAQQFPDPPTLTNPNLDARPWRHPFPKNATTNSTLRNWMVAFADELAIQVQRIQQGYNGVPAVTDYPSVSQWRWYMDVEAWELWTGGINGVKVPDFLASQHGTPNCIWDNWKVPGSVGWQPPTAYPGTNGQTLDEMYTMAASAYGWSPNPEDEFDLEERADHTSNRPEMIWWMGLWANVHQAVLDNACYSVLRAKFGDGIVYGNYESSRTDGLPDTTSWHIAPGPPALPSNNLSRGRIDHQPALGGPVLTKHNVTTSPARYDIWAGHVQTFGTASASATGLVDSPVLYPLSTVQLDGNPAIQQTGHRQPNLYLPGSPPETRFEASTRLHRHMMESINNSGTGLRWNKVRPWVAQYARVPDGENLDIDFYKGDPSGLRMLLAMLRAKNVDEIIFWTPGGLAWQFYAWTDTLELVGQVYSATVTQVKPLYGFTPATEPDPDPLMVAYTLRTPSGQPYACRLEPLCYQNPGNPAESGALAAVQVTLQLESFSEWDGVPAMFGPDYEFDIHVECATRGALVGEEIETGRVLALNYVTGGWIPVPTAQGPDSYKFFTPDASSRRTFRLKRPSNVSYQPYVQYNSDDGTYEMTLRVIHQGAWVHPAGVASWDHSEFDLVQVIPIRVPSPGLGQEEEALPPSDVNFDGQVNGSDVNLFFDAWLEVQDVADLNMDDAVDETDLDIFVDSYMHEGW